jgi:hypothetical protein
MMTVAWVSGSLTVDLRSHWVLEHSELPVDPLVGTMPPVCEELELVQGTSAELYRGSVGAGCRLAMGMGVTEMQIGAATDAVY